METTKYQVVVASRYLGEFDTLTEAIQAVDGTIEAGQYGEVSHEDAETGEVITDYERDEPAGADLVAELHTEVLEAFTAILGKPHYSRGSSSAYWSTPGGDVRLSDHASRHSFSGHSYVVCDDAFKHPDDIGLEVGRSYASTLDFLKNLINSQNEE
jgi:hypothetical protein